MVIHCKRLDQIPLILWGNMHNLSQILHIPGKDSMPTGMDKQQCSGHVPDFFH
jgi:hypothetical protein